MDTALQAKLDRLKYYRTRYELVISRGTERYLVAYTTRNNRRGLWSCVTEEHRAKALIALTGSAAIDFAKRSADGATMSGWTLRFSGRTQRDCYLEGELPYIGDLALTAD